MHWTHTSSGVLTLALLCSNCLLVSEATSDGTSPKIVRPRSPKVKAILGKPLVIPCKAKPGFTDDVTLIYWLVNGSFIEHAYPDGRVRMDQEERVMKSYKTLIRRDLVFQQVTGGDFEATYSCVVSSVAGIDRKEMRLKRVSRICMKERTFKVAGENVRKVSFMDVEDTSRFS